MVDYSILTQISVFLINAVGCWLIYIIYISKTKGEVKKYFILMTFCMLIWVDFAYIARLPSQVNLAIFWIKISWAVTIPLFVSLYFFIIHFVKEKKRTVINSLFFLIGISSFVFTLLTDWVIMDIQSKQVWTKLIYGNKIFLFYFIVLFFSFLVLKLLFKKYFSSSQKERGRILYLLIGVLFFLFMNVVFNIIYPFIFGISNYYQLGDYSTVFSFSFITYAITRHKLIGIKFFAFQVLVAAISIILILDIFILSNEITMQLLKFCILITFLYFSGVIFKSNKQQRKNVKELKKTYRKINHYAKKLETSNEKLEDSNKKLKEVLEIKSEFLHITSHQLRTPLTAIRGMLSMWYDGDFNDLSKRKQRAMLKKIIVSTDRLNNITNDMLDSLELEGGFLKFKFQSVSIEKVIKEILVTLNHNFEKKNLYIKFKTDTKISNAEVELNYIRQVFMNIIDNASKYTRKGGVSISLEKDRKYIKVTIKDTGVGISKADQEKVFTKFTRGGNAINENASGSGLGLFIAKKIIDLHKGKIWIESNGLKKGSSVIVYLRIKQKK